jgi:hypothetical protein
VTRRLGPVGVEKHVRVDRDQRPSSMRS